MQVFAVIAIYPDEFQSTKVDLLEIFSDGPRANDFVRTLSPVGVRPGSGYIRKYFVVERTVR